MSRRAATAGRGHARRVARALPLLALAALALTGCETTQEKSAKLEREAKHIKLADKGLTITRESTQVKVLATAVVHSSEGAAAIVTVQNRSARTLRAVPLAITVKDASGHTIFQNNAVGLESALVSVPSLAPHATLTWVDDQLQLPAGAVAASVSARLGEAPAVSGATPKIAVSGARLEQEPSGAAASGAVLDDSPVEQKPLVVFAVARRGSHIVAAGRAVLPRLAAHASAHFQVLFIGEASGAKLEVAAPPGDFG